MLSAAALMHRLPEGALDIVGDVHGEAEALHALLARLGYDARGRHPAGRRLVFVGDLCDRGPDTPRVIDTVRRIVEAGHGQAVLGNHELNLLRAERKEGNDWFWGQDGAQDRRYEPYARLPADQRQSVLRFFMQLPLTLARQDVRVVHAAWHTPSITQLASPPAALAHAPLDRLFDHWEAQTEAGLRQRGARARAQRETRAWAAALLDSSSEVPVLEAVAECDAARQMGNPLRVLTSGAEHPAPRPLFAGGQWRFVVRQAWWDDYRDATPVVVGHFWRRLREPAGAAGIAGEPGLFKGIAPQAWHGARRNVFCVDFCAGGRFHERRHGHAVGHSTPLAALRWPERTLVFDHGPELPTTGFGLAA